MLLYTANIGGYDQLQVTPQPGFDFMFFQNQKKGLTKVKSARYYKTMLPYDFGPIVWLDANIKINCNLKFFVDKWFKDDIDMVVMEHGRDCIYEEMDACIERKKDTVENIERQRQFYLKEGFPKHAGMVGTGIIIKSYSHTMSAFMGKWFEMIKEYSHRDQLSFNYVLWKLDIKLKLAYIPYSVFGNEFELVPHENK